MAANVAGSPEEGALYILVEKIDQIQKDIEEIKVNVHRTDEAVRGNGTPGLRTDVSNNQKSIKMMLWVGAAIAIPTITIVINLALGGK